jgi:hypothetical protein
MSKPANNADNRDVQSSVRWGAGVPVPRDPEAARQHPLGVLVLTPAQRIASPDVFVLGPECKVVVGNAALAETDETADAAARSPADREPPRTRGPAAAGEGGAGDAAELRSRVAALEAAIARAVEEWQPEGGGANDLVDARFRSMPRRDQGHPDTEDALSAETAAETADTPPRAARLPGASAPVALGDLIDEDALRAMVSEIVRAELQGKLGKRITWNLRKLVRREIHRALVEEGLE